MLPFLPKNFLRSATLDSLTLTPKLSCLSVPHCTQPPFQFEVRGDTYRGPTTTRSEISCIKWEIATWNTVLIRCWIKRAYSDPNPSSIESPPDSIPCPSRSMERLVRNLMKFLLVSTSMSFPLLRSWYCYH